ncbi:MAG: hypothetical protein CMJ52_08205 [Planctomycetaceae bacterium]|nr:hypothetical protein [Planctomycetaceae bacterium]
MIEDLASDRGIRFGVIGFGFMGRTHASAMSGTRAASLSAVVDRDPDRLTGLASGGGNMDTGGEELVFDPSEVPVFANVDEMLAECELDLAIVTTPTPTHIEIASSLVSAGLHVLVEKPVSLDPAAIEELAALARQRRVMAMPAHCMRFWPAWAWMRRQVEEQAYGPVRRASFVRTGAAPSWNPDFYLDPSQSGGAIVDLHIHDTDFVIHCFGEPTAVSSTGSRSHVRTEYFFEGGPSVEAVGGWLEDPDAPFTMTAEIACRDGTISFSLDRTPEVLVTDPEGRVHEHPEASVGGTGYDMQARALVDAILAGRRVPPVTLEEAALTGRVIELEIDSAASDGESRSTR